MNFINYDQINFQYPKFNQDTSLSVFAPTYFGVVFTDGDTRFNEQMFAMFVTC